jgi:glucose/arabinose dehydrogenase
MKSSKVFNPRFLALLFVSVFLNAAVMHASEGSIRLESVLQGLSSPVYITNAHDGTQRLFIVEQTGRIKVLASGAATPSVFLDITSKVLFGGEQGLLGLAFHPQFATNSRFFVNYTRQTDGATVIAEYHASSDPAVTAASEIILLAIAQPYANHNGGMIEFSGDGYLYIGMGDGGSANDPEKRAQNIDELLGKILRIDVDHPAGGQMYSSPPDNPFAGATPGRDEIFALGLRNPFRFSFDRQTGQLYVGDVGQNLLEEIDIVTLGGNYGWRVYEGANCTGLDPGLCTPANFVAPIAQYDHSGGRCSIIGGYVYHGPAGALPAGTYVFGDFCSGEIFSLASGAPNLLLDTSLSISSFGEDEAGEIYVVGLGGTVHRIASLSSTATTTMLMTSGSPATVGASVTFTATVAGTNPTGSVNFTDGGTSIAGCAAVALSGVGNTRTAACSTSSLSTGTHSIVAAYGGDAGNAASNSAALSQVINTGTDVVWVDDAVPGGATLAGDGGDGWSWIASNPVPYSGSLAHQSVFAAGEHQHYFYDATTTLAVVAGDTLFAYVYLDPANPPSEVMLQWNDGSWEHRAYWGANLIIGWGTDGTVSRRFMGALPATGQWVRLSVPAAQVGLEGRTLNGMAYTLYGGRATWDYAGKAAGAITPTYQLSGAVTLSGTGLSGVNFAAAGGGNCTVSDAAGRYACTVTQGWSGTVTPSLSGYSFTPSSRSYSSVAADQGAQDYAASVMVGGLWNTFARDPQHTALSTPRRSRSTRFIGRPRWIYSLNTPVTIS